MEKLNKEKVKKIADIALNVLIWTVVVFSILITILVFTAQSNKDGVPSIFGKSLVTIETNSMEPTYKVNDMVFMTKLSDAEKLELKPGDIITYRAPIDLNEDGVIGDINTHRIVSVDKDALRVQTRGDNKLTNVKNDDYTVHHSNIIGICTEKGKIGGLGGVIDFLRSSLGFFLCIVLPLVLFFLYELYKFIMLIASERAKRAPVSSETEEEIKKRAIEEYLKSQQAAAAEAAAAKEPVVAEAPAEEAPAEEAADTEEK